MKYLILLILLFSLNISAQDSSKDTLYIKFDKQYLKKEKHPVKDFSFYRIKGSGNNGIIYFIEESVVQNLNPSSKVVCFKTILRKAKAKYRFKGQRKIADAALLEYFNKSGVKTYYLKKGNNFIKITPIYEID